MVWRSAGVSAGNDPTYLPVIIISARTSEMHRVLGLEMGADYLAKPFSTAGAYRRVKALFRRQEAMGRNLLMDAGRLSCHGLSIDPLSRAKCLLGEIGGSAA